MYNVEFTRNARRNLASLEPKIKERMRQAVRKLADKPQIGYKLKGHLVELWSYRVGAYRIIYKIHKKEITVLILAIGHRSSIYR